MAADGSRQADDARRRLELIRSTIQRQTRNLVLALDTKPRTSQTVRQQAANLRLIRQQIDDRLAAIEPQVRAIVVDEAANLALEIAEEEDLAEFAPDIERQVDAIISTQTRDIADTFEDASRAIGDAIALGTTTGAELGEIVDEVARQLETSFVRAQAAVDTAIMGAGRSITVGAAIEGEDPNDPTVLFVAGPEDEKNRPWCEKHVGKAYTPERLERDGPDAGQPTPVAVFAGGYNCRHTFAPMRMSDARKEGIEVFR
jgi:hypothetical protein